jgi:hypothetical protein
MPNFHGRGPGCLPVVGDRQDVCQSGFTILPPEPLSERPTVVLLRGRRLASLVVRPCERGGHDDLHGLGHLSVTPYVHGRTELYFYSSLPCLILFCFSTP